MKTTYHNIPALPCAADADVEALRRQLEGGNLEANEDGTVSVKDSKATKSTIAQNNANAAKKKLGDVPGGVLGADPPEENAVSPEIAAMINEFRSDEDISTFTNVDKKAKKFGDVPGGVLG